MAGTAVLVMTDVEGSTRLWAEHPDGMSAAMARHHAIVHSAVTAHGGWRPVDQGEGDAVFAAFESAPAAVAAVADFQRRLVDERWPPGVDLRVRVGMHAGDVITRDGNLFGSTVNRCARLRGLGAGGQVLLSAAVFELVRDALPDGVSVTDLGTHRMKDLSRPEHVHQLLIFGLRSDFPPLASLDRARHNLPVQTSSFLGRTQEIEGLIDLVRRERLVTIVGFGGMGKTRLALQVAAELADGDGDGVWFVDLSPLVDPGQIPAAIAATLGVTEGPEGVMPAVVAALRRKRLLLVLDNLEQLLPEAATVVDQIVRAGSGVRVLATSREPLRLSGEHEFALSALPVPPAPRPGTALTDAELGSLSTYDAVRLFIRRASAVRRDFALTAGNAAAIAAICVRLDGMPLALELAAARTRSLSPEALLPRLDRALTVLTGGSRDLPKRQQTVRATIAWSYDALSPDEQQLLDRLSVFRGSFTLDAAEAICGPAIPGRGTELDVLTGLTSLVDHSLVIHQPTDASAVDRYSMLVSVHEYAAEQLDRAGDTATTRNRHARYYAELVKHFPTMTAAEDDRRWQLAELDIVELRAALDHLLMSLAGPGECTLATHVAEVLWSQGLSSDARSVLDRTLSRAVPATVGRIELLLTRSGIDWVSGRTADATSSSDQALAEAESLGEPSVLAAALANLVPRTRAEGLHIIARLDEALAQLPNTTVLWPRWKIDSYSKPIAMLFVDPDRTDSVTRAELDIGEAPVGPMAGLNLGYVHLNRGRLAEAERLLAPLEHQSDTELDTVKITGLFYASIMRIVLRQPAVAINDLAQVDRLLDRVELPRVRKWVAIRRAAARRQLGDRLAAADALSTVLREAQETEADQMAIAWFLLAVLSRESGDKVGAADHLRQAWALVAGWDARCLDQIFECLLERATQIMAVDPEEATRLIGMVNAQRGDFIFLHGVDYDTDGMLADLRSTLGDAEVDRILTLASTQELPDSPTWPEPYRDGS